MPKTAGSAGTASEAAASPAAVGDSSSQARRPAPANGATARCQPGGTRNFGANRLVYAVISQRARGLSIGVTMNPDKRCNFDCLYCDVDRTNASGSSVVDVPLMERELHHMLTLARDGRIRELPGWQSLPEEVLELKEVALSGEGEPTLCPNFKEVVEAVVHVRALKVYPFFKIVLITNASHLDRPEVKPGLRLLTPRDEIWAKLDVGTQAYLERVNRTTVPLEKILHNIETLGRERPIVIQSLFPEVNGVEPPDEEIEQYVRRLAELRERGASISLVQVYSAHRPAVYPDCRHLKLKTLSHIAQRVREVAGLKAEVF